MSHSYLAGGSEVVANQDGEQLPTEVPADQSTQFTLKVATLIVDGGMPEDRARQVALRDYQTQENSNV